jgi:hypothetical protein
VVALCRRCLSPSPADRPADGQAVADQLTAYLNGVQERLRAAEIVRAEANERAKAKRHARRIQVIAASLVLLALVGGIVGTSIGMAQAVRARQAEANRAVAEARQRQRAETAESETKARADELKLVSDFQSDMLKQIDPTRAGIDLTADVAAKFAAALAKDKVPEAENASCASLLCALCLEHPGLGTSPIAGLAPSPASTEQVAERRGWKENCGQGDGLAPGAEAGPRRDYWAMTNGPVHREKVPSALAWPAGSEASQLSVPRHWRRKAPGRVPVRR